MFESERLVYRGVEEAADLEWMWKSVGNNAEVLRLLSAGPPAPSSKEEQKKNMNQETKLPRFTICLKPTPGAEPEGTLPGIGFVSLFNGWFNYKTRTAMIALALPDPKLRNKGYGREVLNWMLDYCFLHLGLHRIEIGCFSFNEPAWHLYRSIGFIEEGRKRKAVLDNGEWHDIIEMAMLEEEWTKLRKLPLKERDLSIRSSNTGSGAPAPQ